MAFLEYNGNGHEHVQDHTGVFLFLLMYHGGCTICFDLRHNMEKE